MLIIDGSYLEGGGQIVRTSVGLASLFKIPIKIVNVRANRKPPGLKRQHYTMLKFLEKVTNAKTRGIEIGSREVYFEPKQIKGGEYFVDIKTAGSISLFLQGAILPLLFADSKVELTIKGGTDVKHSPSMDYFKEVFIPYLRKFAEIDLEIIRRGFYPRGGGIVKLTINPKIPRDLLSLEDFLNTIRKLKPYNLVGNIIYEKVKIIAVSTKDLRKRKVNERMIEAAKKLINLPIEIESYYVKALSTGAVITIVGKNNISLFGSDSLGEIGKKAEEVGKEAATKFLDVINSKASVDEHLADMLIPYLALVGGKFKTNKFTNHLLTNIWVTEKFFGKIFEINEGEKIIECKLK